eukprot:165866-Alexandrium_andersonii.AAC.1
MYPFWVANSWTPDSAERCTSRWASASYPGLFCRAAVLRRGSVGSKGGKGRCCRDKLAHVFQSSLS